MKGWGGREGVNMKEEEGGGVEGKMDSNCSLLMIQGGKSLHCIWI